MAKIAYHKIPQLVMMVVFFTLTRGSISIQMVPANIAFEGVISPVDEEIPVSQGGQEDSSGTSDNETDERDDAMILDRILVQSFQLFLIQPTASTTWFPIQELHLDITTPPPRS